ncbi:bifunctional lysozyme/C40 family peptidase [Clostridium algoriphilum]|uniref:bifunctional lytic transglycosylase/C40 family peptidase n=1 Tax=Clostridium algoriphilum TaxID=198347 RepID=UPI001CF20D25|nr:bifunctional lytic transglycosylase/C40 family peptidase [Clostridium algoriphilum]MCB2293688.1 bifunctional lysozyme/C40 family peptidase [Clostridium algoriphilum]
MKFKLIKFIIGLIIFLLVVIMAIFGNGNAGSTGKAKVPDKISRWRPIVQEYCKKYKCSEYVDFLLALMYQEIGETDTLDVMQSSESINLSPNTIKDPIRSIDSGVKHFKSVLDYGNSKGVDFKTIVQSYNFGSGYIDYVSSNGKKHTKELATSFSAKEASVYGWSSYGDVNYVDHVMNKVDKPVEGEHNTNIALEDTKYTDLMKVALKYEGRPYVFGGSSPAQGFDCSGIIQYAYSQVGVKLSRTAQNQFDQSTIVPSSEAKPGDLVFFTGTYDCPDYITHVGIYVGNNKMYQSGGSGLGYIDLTKPYYQEHLVGIGRINK